VWVGALDWSRILQVFFFAASGGVVCGALGRWIGRLRSCLGVETLADALVGSNDGRHGVLAAEADDRSVHAHPQLEASRGLLHLLVNRFREKS
jgi:hypothetical protein